MVAESDEFDEEVKDADDNEGKDDGDDGTEEGSRLTCAEDAMPWTEIEPSELCDPAAIE